jgi:hypothetical protein
MSIADTGRFWKILVIPVLQILEDSRKQVLGLIFQNIQHISLPNSK